MQKTALNISYEAYFSGTSGTGTDRFLIPQRDYITVSRERYIVPILQDMLDQCEPHGLGVLCRLESTELDQPWKIVPAYSVDDAKIAAKLACQRGGEFWDSWLQSWQVSDYEPPVAKYNRPERRLADLIAAIG
jgi:hypothetical protein